MLRRDTLTSEPAISPELLSQGKQCVLGDPGISVEDLHLKFQQTPFTCEKHTQHLQSLRNQESIHSWLDYKDTHENGQIPALSSPLLISSGLPRSQRTQ